MKKLLRWMTGKPDRAPAELATHSVQRAGFEHSKMQPTSAASPVSIQDDSDNGIRRQLVQVLLRDALRRHGIPAQWIEMQLLAVTSSKGAGMYVRLVLKHWDERLMCYLVPFQNKFVADVTRFEPNASEWLYGISWQLELDQVCPYKTMPEKEFWTVNPPGKVVLGSIAAKSPQGRAAQPVQAVAAVNKQDEVLEDIERLFAIRDQELAHDILPEAHQTGFEPTQTQPFLPSARPPLF